MKTFGFMLVFGISVMFGKNLCGLVLMTNNHRVEIHFVYPWNWKYVKLTSFGTRFGITVKDA